MDSLPLLLLQIRDPDDPMRQQEAGCFERALGKGDSLQVHSLLEGAPDSALLKQVRGVLIGGSGDYSVVDGGPWLDDALQTMRQLVASCTPTFASCWGFQALARALGGVVVTSLDNSELGTIEVQLTSAGRTNPLTASLPPKFAACMGHQDMVLELPAEAQRLAFSDRVLNQAFCIPGKPIFATQFHPELMRADFLQRVAAYPQYLRKLTGESIESFEARCVDTPEANQLIRSFLRRLEQAQSGEVDLR